MEGEEEGGGRKGGGRGGIGEWEGRERWVSMLYRFVFILPQQ